MIHHCTELLAAAAFVHHADKRALKHYAAHEGLNCPLNMQVASYVLASVRMTVLTIDTLDSPDSL